MTTLVYAGTRAVTYRPEKIARCCLREIDVHGKDVEGDLVECRDCMSLLAYHDGAWQHEYDEGDI